MMFKKTLSQFVIVLTATQLVFSHWALAQMTPSNKMFDTNPLSTGTTTGVKAGGMDDPWGMDNPTGNGNVWNPSSGNWNMDPSMGSSTYYDPNSYGYSSSYGYGMQNPNDSAMISYLKWNGVLQKNYKAEIAKRRMNYGYTNNAVIAQQIIEKAVTDSARISAGTTLFSWATSSLATLIPNSTLSGTTQVMTYGISAGFDFTQTYSYQAEMILSLAALYGELPDNPDARMSLITDAYAAASVIAAGVKITSFGVQKLIEKKLGVTAANASELILRQTIADALLAKGVAKEIINEVVLKAETPAAAQALLKQASNMGLWAKISDIAKSEVVIKYLIPGVVAAGAAGVSYLINKIYIFNLGRASQVKFMNDQKLRLRASIDYVNNKSLARKTLWLILLKNILPQIPDYKAKKSFANIVAKEFPFNRSERDAAFAEMEKNPKLVDENLRRLHSDMGTNVDAKLYFIKVILAAMYLNAEATKQELGESDRVTTISDEFEKMLDTLTIALGITIPLNQNAQTINEKDPRFEYKTLYTSMRGELDKTYRIKADILAKAPSAQNSGDTKSTAAGNILLEDFKKAEPYKGLDKLLEKVKTEGKSPEVSKGMDELNKKATEDILKEINDSATKK